MKKTTYRIIKRVGLDSDVMIMMIDDKYEFSEFKPKLYRKDQIFFINYIVFGETLNFLIKQHGLTKEQAVNKIFNFLRENRITLIKKSQTDQTLVLDTFDKLKKQRELLKNNASNSDLMIISVYKNRNIDLIFSRNADHFRPFCRYLNIDFKKLKEDVDIMWRRTFGWRKRHK